MSETIAEKAAAVVDGLHHRRGVEYLAAAAGMEPDKIGAAVVFGVEVGFSEATGFFKESKGRGYWMTTLNECSCPDYRYRKAGTGKLCKHQKKLCAVLKARESPKLPAGVVPLSDQELDARRERIAARNAERRAAMEPSTSVSRGFNMPEVVA